MADRNAGSTGNTELDNFHAELRKLREDAGQPSLRAMSRTAHYSHTALSGVVSGGRLPSIDLTLAYVRACGGDEEEWRARWHQARRRVEADAAENAVGPQDPGLHTATPPAGRRRRHWLIAACAASAVAVVGVTLAMIDSGASTPGSKVTQLRLADCPARPDPGDHPLIACDDSRFVADVTVPDGTIVRAGQRFIKTWEIQDSGLVPWRGRFLQREGLVGGPGLCDSPSRVPVPTTLPGQDVLISVTFTAPALPGSCRVDWKMTDGNGRFYFPGLGDLYMVVNVAG